MNVGGQDFMLRTEMDGTYNSLSLSLLNDVTIALDHSNEDQTTVNHVSYGNC
jgi:hypothetical protein